MQKNKGNKLYEWLKEGKTTLVFYESSKRIVKTLNGLEEYFGEEKRVLVARELTKLHETLYRGKISDVIEQMGSKTIKGEIVVVVEGK